MAPAPSRRGEGLLHGAIRSGYAGPLLARGGMESPGAAGRGVRDVGPDPGAPGMGARPDAASRRRPDRGDGIPDREVGGGGALAVLAVAAAVSVGAVERGRAGPNGAGRGDRRSFGRRLRRSVARTRRPGIRSRAGAGAARRARLSAGARVPDAASGPLL